MNTSILNIENLSIGFGSGDKEDPALKEVSFEIYKGELVAVVGESGSGKSITALSILKLLPSPPANYRNGHIFFNETDEDKDMLKCPIEQLQQIRGNRIAMIFQEPMTSLNPVVKCGIQVKEAILRHKSLSGTEAKKQVLQLFEKVKLPDPERIYNSYPHQISGGQKQRVMIAMAVSCDPALLICDEPTTALDVTVQKNILQLIKDLQLQNDMAVLFITHDLNLVSEIADRIVVMYNGCIVEQGSAQTILTDPRHPYTKALLACRPALYAKGERLPVVSDFIGGEKQKDISVPAKKETSAVFPEPSKECILSVNDLHVWFPVKKSFLGKPLNYTKAVNGVSFQVYEGETVGLVGESGCGKTTLGRGILQLVKPTSGEIIFKGKNISFLNKEGLKSLRQQMQIIFQDPYSSLNPRMTIGEAIAEPLLVHGYCRNKKDCREQVVDLLQKVNLSPEHYTRYPHEFSGGQRQRIVIARALALKPSFVVCDESISALDVSMQAQILNLLNDLKSSFGFTSIFISHDLSVVRYISDRILVMKSGAIVESGTAEDIYNHPQHEYTRTLLAAIPGKKMN